jgi:Rrf2 family iron-sulfur cluster assembly transcriptional regulator
MFSKACEYAIRATIFIVDESEQGRRVNLKEISQAINSPEAFTAKILQQLARGGVIRSVKGPSGGFETDAEHAKQLKLSKLVSVIDGDDIYRGCGLGLVECDENRPCPLHDKFKEIRDDLKNMLEQTSIFELTSGLRSELTHLKQ